MHNFLAPLFMIILFGAPSFTWGDLEFIKTAKAATPMPMPPEGRPRLNLKPLYAVKLPQPMRGHSLNKDHTVMMVGHLDAEEKITFNLWNTSDNTLLRTLESSKSRAPAKFSPDGKHVFAGAIDLPGIGVPRYGRISAIWRVEDGALLKEIDFAENAYKFSPDGSLLLSKKMGTGGLFEFPEMKLVLEIKDITGNTVFSNDGTLLASPTDSMSKKEIGLWKVSNGERIMTFKAKSGFWHGEIQSVAISPDNTLLAAGHEDGIDVWTISDGTFITRVGQKFEGKKFRARHFPLLLFFSKDNQRILVGYYGFFNKPKTAGIRVWRVADGAMLSEFHGKGTKAALPWIPSYDQSLGVLVEKLDDDVKSFWHLPEVSRIFNKPN